jgi:hypothetical protein
VKILFGALHHGYYRNLESVVEELARRGHDIFLGSERAAVFGGDAFADHLAASYPNITPGTIPSREPESLFLASKIRLGFDYVRYLEPMYDGSSGLRPRAQIRTPTGVVRLARSPLMAFPPARRMVRGALDAIDRAVPPSPAIERFLDDLKPELVIITPLIGLVASSQLDLLRSAIARGLPTAVFVWSWDHLSSKAIIRDDVDGLFVWNDAQKREAIEMHGVPPERIVVTGAQCYDKWFGRTPSRSRAAFVRDAGLPDERPFVLWACSALLPGSPPEPDVVMEWAERLRQSTDPRVRNAAILIRPHPSRAAEWDGVDWRRFGNISMFGTAPIDEQAKSDYFDSLYYSGAVVGITTSAFIEAAVLGRPVMTYYREDLRQEHEGSLHYQHLLDPEHGLLVTAASLDEHERQLASMLAGPPPEISSRVSKFVRRFVRPQGLETPATGIAVEALERLALRTAPALARRPSTLGRAGLSMVAALERSPRWRSLLLDEREAEASARQEGKEWLKAQALERKKKLRAEKARRAGRKPSRA